MKTEQNTNQESSEADSQKAVSFAMSIAQEMKRRQREIDDSNRKDETDEIESRGNRYGADDLSEFEQKLIATQDEIRESVRTLKATVGIEEDVEVEPDGGDGTNQSMRLDVMAQIEKAHKSLTDIEEAVRRINDGSYGICMTCGKLIAKERLLHSPFVKTCTACQEALEKNAF